MKIVLCCQRKKIGDNKMEIICNDSCIVSNELCNAFGSDEMDLYIYGIMNIDFIIIKYLFFHPLDPFVTEI